MKDETTIQQQVKALCNDLNYEMLTQEQWKMRSEPHPYPEINLPPSVRDHRVLPCQVGYVGAPACWVDAGSASQFGGTFPMTPIHLLPPDGLVFQNLEPVRDVMQRLMTYAAGERQSRRVASAYAVNAGVIPVRASG